MNETGYALGGSKTIVLCVCVCGDTLKYESDFIVLFELIEQRRLSIVFTTL